MQTKETLSILKAEDILPGLSAIVTGDLLLRMMGKIEEVHYGFP